MGEPVRKPVLRMQEKDGYRKIQQPHTYCLTSDNKVTVLCDVPIPRTTAAEATHDRFAPHLDHSFRLNHLPKADLLLAMLALGLPFVLGRGISLAVC